MSKKIEIGNWTPYVQSEINGKESASFIVGRSGGGGSDPATGCKKRFTATYQCGTGAPKEVNIAPEAWGQAGLFDCTAEGKLCADFRLTLGDDGNMVITNGNNSTLWSSNTNKTGLALPKFSAKKGKYGRNYLLAGEVLNIGDFVGSPSGNCYLMMVKDTGLQLKYNMSGCTTAGESSEENAFATYSIEPVNVSNIGKVGYISNDGRLHDYPTAMVGQGSTYELIGNYESKGNDIQQMTGSVDQCKKTCNDLKECYGFVHKSAKKSSGGVQFVKIHFPEGREPTCIQISQIAVYSGGVNVAKNKSVSTANTYTDAQGVTAAPENAVDGVLSGHSYPNIYHSMCQSGDYWLLDLQQEYPVEKVVYYNRADCCAERAKGMLIDLMDGTKKTLKTLTLTGDPVQSFEMAVGQTASVDTCWLKNAGMFPSGLRQSDDNYELYTRNKAVQNNNSCSKVVQSTTLTNWESLPAGDKMTIDTLCSLGAITEQERKDLENKHNNLAGIAGILDDKLQGLNRENSKINNSMKLNKTKLTSDINTYSDVWKQADNHVANSDSVNAMMEDTDLTMISQNYKHLVWTILAILFIIGAIRITRN
jgi:hypothetical protein